MCVDKDTMMSSTSHTWGDQSPLQPHKLVASSVYKNLCLLSVVFAFSVGLTIGILIPMLYLEASDDVRNQTDSPISEDIGTVFLNNSYGRTTTRNASYPAVTFVETTLTGDDNGGGLVEGGIYWGEEVERALPEGYRDVERDTWSAYVEKAVAVKMEIGCGRMQNRLVTFQDGLKGCVRYRQNTDQIQGELFSFYLADILGLPNLAPSTVSVVDLGVPLWQQLGNEIASAQWNSNRPVVLTQFIADLEPADIPQVFKPAERHLDGHDVVNMTRNFGTDRSGLIRRLVELAQWSDLIVFDYLTANLDRIVNNLYNYQWNANIMDAPAHNLAKKSDSDLLVFLDNESGLLHGYRLLKKYEIYHSILLENLCVFRRTTADKIRRLRAQGDVGLLLRAMFDKHNGDVVKDILPTIPNKSVKILNERIDKVYNQISKCESIFSNT